MTNELQHYGVLGMKWGVRKQPQSTGTGRRRTATVKTYGTGPKNYMYPTQQVTSAYDHNQAMANRRAAVATRATVRKVATTTPHVESIYEHNQRIKEEQRAASGNKEAAQAIAGGLAGLAVVGGLAGLTIAGSSYAKKKRLIEIGNKTVDAYAKSMGGLNVEKGGWANRKTVKRQMELGQKVFDMYKFRNRQV